MKSNIYLTNREKELIIMLIDHYCTSGSSLDTDEELMQELMELDMKIDKSNKKK